VSFKKHILKAPKGIKLKDNNKGTNKYIGEVWYKKNIQHWKTLKKPKLFGKTMERHQKNIMGVINVNVLIGENKNIIFQN
jgi:hypothetical protein